MWSNVVESGWNFPWCWVHLWCRFCFSPTSTIIERLDVDQLCSIHWKECRNCQMAIWLNFPRLPASHQKSHNGTPSNFLRAYFTFLRVFSAAAFPLALIAKMVHNLPYLFPQDPEPPPNRKCLIWNDFSPEKIKKCRWLNYTATNFLLWEQKIGVFVKTA